MSRSARGTTRGGAGRRLPVGKLPVPLLRALLARHAPRRDPRVIVGPGIGLDAAAIDVGAPYVVVTSDPITLVQEEIGTYALAINANDLAAMGATPRWFVATILLPAGTTTRRDAARLFAQIGRACRRLDISLCGGHTEVTDAVTRPVVVGCLLGPCRKGRVLSSADARVGDALLLTKGLPIEAVSILARARAGELRRRYSARFVARCRRYLRRPGLSVVRDAALALSVGGVHAMHDPTEGGLSAALYELAEAAGVGVRIEETAVPILPEGRRLCAHFGLDPLGAIASGALLISAAPPRAPAMLRRLRAAGIAAARIGTVVPARRGITLVGEGGKAGPLRRFTVDEVARLLGRRAPAADG